MMYMFAHVHDDQYAICVECNWCVKNYFCGMYIIISLCQHLPTWMLICACATTIFKGVSTCSYDVYPCTRSWWLICTLRRVQLICQILFFMACTWAKKFIVEVHFMHFDTRLTSTVIYTDNIIHTYMHTCIHAYT